MTKLSFHQLNHGWNADPNAAEPVCTRSGLDLVLQFALNPLQFTQFAIGDIGFIRFVDCARYRLGVTNDEGWFRGQCRYSKSAPAWGEFYELIGDDPRLNEPDDWTVLDGASGAPRHFLFYFRDETFECIASNWIFEPVAANSLFKHFPAGLERSPKPDVVDSSTPAS